ncbi:MAG: glutamate--tRNA ligase [Victivallales bacterium]|nr:glutamate--tRNA ligase [Victivallales bacterium]
MSVRVRFAPSPTGQVHIGNIRAAIFNWLFARHEKGTFLLRIEDTDLERSTPEAIRTLLEVMDWLKLDFDEKPPLYQTSQVSKHLEAAEKLLAQGDAYRDNKGGGGEAIVFRIPWDAEKVPGVIDAGPAEVPVHPDKPVVVSMKGVDYAGISAKGTQAPGGACLAGFKNLKIYDAAGNLLFDIAGKEEGILHEGAVYEVPGAAKLSFTRRTITYHDLVKGDMTKPLDSMRDVVIVRSDGSPVFHLANVMDDITQGVTHIIRGDDHVENTFRHIMLFTCLGAVPPAYGHLPMIVNAAGKPYSKRDGDAFVGDFKDKGYLADALVNYLALLGWSPGDDREKMTREELVEAFSLERCLHSSAQMDVQKLTNLNGQYIAEMPLDDFMKTCRDYVAKQPWSEKMDETVYAEVCKLMQSRTKTFSDVSSWGYFFVDTPSYDEKVCAKQFKDSVVCAALDELAKTFATLPQFTAAAIEEALNAQTDKSGLGHGKLNQPLRAAITGVGIGAGIYETAEILGRSKTLERMEFARRYYPAN